jgi:membrane associated rhomboid family serine protease
MFIPISDDTPRLRAPWVTILIVAACVLVYFYQLMLLPDDALRLARAAGVVPWELRHLSDLVGGGQPRDLVPPPLTVFTSLFVHCDFWHILGNMVFLWVFGSKLEGFLGTLRYLGLFFVAAMVAAAMQVWVAPESTMPMIGASGAIAGVLGGHAVLFPHARVRCFVFLWGITYVFIELRAALLLGLWFLVQFLSAGGSEPGVAWFAHIGGFLVGFVLAHSVRLLRPARRVVYHRPSWRPRTVPGSW